MANVFTPNGFTPVRRYDGAAWSANITQYYIKQNNGHHFYAGDPVFLLSTGYIDVVSGNAGTTCVPLGIFIGCERLSTASGAKVWSNQFNGDAQQDVNAWIVDDPLLVFRVWTGTGSGSVGGGPVALGNIGDTVAFQYGTGNSYSGISGSYIDFSTVQTSGSTYPFVIIGQVASNPPGVNGTDITTAGNVVEVMMAAQQFAKAGVTAV